MYEPGLRDLHADILRLRPLSSTQAWGDHNLLRALLGRGLDVRSEPAFLRQIRLSYRFETENK
jgi:hypothetical protein